MGTDLTLTLNFGQYNPFSDDSDMKFSNQNYMKLRHLIITCFLFSFLAAADPNYVSINCGGAAAATALGGREWLRDAAPKGSSKASTVRGDLIAAIDPVPYRTARISLSQFSYSFRLTPGQKFLRLHFNPASYHGFETCNDLFTVEAGKYTLLGNFSASITARALAVNTLAKEFCIIIPEKQHLLDIVFSPESKYNYAFINGIEIISLPSTISYCDGGERGIHVLGQKHAIHLESTTALEMVHRRNIKWGSDDGMFGMWASEKKRAYNKSWTVGVDVGFRYMVRLHLCELGLKVHRDFVLLINGMIALTSPDMLHQRGVGSNHLWYNYMVMVEGQKREGKRNISISLDSQQAFFDRHGPFEGFEVFKLSNHDCSLASPNPPLYSHAAAAAAADSRLGRKTLNTTVVIAVLCLATIVVHLLHKIRIPPEKEEEEERSKPSARAKQLCRCFTLTEINIATDYFDPGFVLGKGGFGIVYKGNMDNGREIVAIKRLKTDSKQGEHEFWTEIETLCELRHVNLISLIGYCREKQEMILVYEYIPSGTLADHLYKLARKKNEYFPPLSWEQRLNICIGAARAIDYFHTQGIIHRDVKTSNILLDERFVAKVADFGLAKYVATISGGSQSTNLKGTRGYIDPNFYKTHRLTKESDIYSFGVVLLEVLSERAAAAGEGAWSEEGYLSRWARDKISKGEVNDIVASSLRGQISPDSLNTFVKIAERCLLDEPKERPAMTHIIIELELALVQQQKAESSIDIVEEGNRVILLPWEENERATIILGNVPSLPREGMSNGIIMTSGGRQTLMRKASRKLWPIWKTRKSSYKTDLLGIAVSGAEVAEYSRDEAILHMRCSISPQGADEEQ